MYVFVHSLLGDFGPPSPPPPYSPPAEGKKGFGQGMGDQVDRGIQKDAADSVRPETRVPGGWFGWLLGIERVPSAKRRMARLERSVKDELYPSSELWKFITVLYSITNV